MVAKFIVHQPTHDLVLTPGMLVAFEILNVVMIFLDSMYILCNPNKFDYVCSRSKEMKLNICKGQSP